MTVRLSATETALAEALSEARAYVNGVYLDHANHGWRRETAAGVLERIDAALAASRDTSPSASDQRLASIVAANAALEADDERYFDDPPVVVDEQKEADGG